MTHAQAKNKVTPAIGWPWKETIWPWKEIIWFWNVVLTAASDICRMLIELLEIEEPLMQRKNATTRIKQTSRWTEKNQSIDQRVNLLNTQKHRQKWRTNLGKQSRGDDAVHIGYSLVHRLSMVVGLVSVAKFQCFVNAGGCTGRNSSAEKSFVGGQIHFDGRIATTVEDGASEDFLDGHLDDDGVRGGGERGTNRVGSDWRMRNGKWKKCG